MNIVLLHPNEKCYLKVFSENDTFENPIVVLKKNEHDQYLLKDEELNISEFYDLQNNLWHKRSIHLKFYASLDLILYEIF